MDFLPCYLQCARVNDTVDHLPTLQNRAGIALQAKGPLERIPEKSSPRKSELFLVGKDKGIKRGIKKASNNTGR